MGVQFHPESFRTCPKTAPTCLCLIVSVRDSTTEAYRQIHRVGPTLIDFKGETAREDRKRLALAPALPEPRQLCRRRDRAYRRCLRLRTQSAVVLRQDRCRQGPLSPGRCFMLAVRPRASEPAGRQHPYGRCRPGQPRPDSHPGRGLPRTRRQRPLGYAGRLLD